MIKSVVCRFLGFVNVGSICLSVLALSATLNLLQASRISELSAARRAETTIVGKRLDDINMTAADGRRVTLSFGDGQLGTIIYYYSRSCGWCERNWQNVRALRKASRDQYRFVAIAIDPRSLTSSAAVGLADLIGVVSDQTRRALGLRGTPSTLLVSRDGLVLKSWRGAFTGRTLQEVQDTFGVSLPGLRAFERPSN